MSTTGRTEESGLERRELDFALPQLLPPPPVSYGAAGSLIAHIGIGAAIVFLASLPIPEPAVSDISIGTKNVTPLVAPPVDRPLTLPELMSRQAPIPQGAPEPQPAQAPPAPAAAPVAPKQLQVPTPKPVKQQELIADATTLPPNEQTTADPLFNRAGQINAAPPVIQASEQPAARNTQDAKSRIAFESPSAQVAGRGVPGGKVPLPQSARIEDMGRVMARSGGGGLVVGDAIGSDGGGGALGSLSTPKSQSQVQILGDTMGVDFRPYLVQVLASVKRNWLAIIPESARMGGRRGKVTVQLAIARDGSVPKLVIASGSGTEALDRAAVAGISASNPFPPLPSEFQGPQIRLQFTFAYNVQ